MHEKIANELTTVLKQQAVAYGKVKLLRNAAPVLEKLLATDVPFAAHWLMWASEDKINVYLSLMAESILFDSPVAEVLERLESILMAEFASNMTPEGDILYTFTTPEQINLCVLAILTETGTCRKVICGYEKRTETRYVDFNVETDTPIYSLVCGGEDV